MWVNSITLRNIKCFNSIDISFIESGRNNSDTKSHRWVTILGENGTGKSTILQSLGLLLAGPEAAKELLPRPEGWVRNRREVGEIAISIHREDLDAGEFGRQRPRKKFSYKYNITGNTPVSVSAQTYTEPIIIEERSKILSWLRVNAFASKGSIGWFSTGYGAFRRLSRNGQILVPSLDQPTRSSNFLAQFDEDKAMNSFERWLVQLDFRQAKDPKDQQARRMRIIGEQAITRLLPGNVRIAEVTPNGRIIFLVNGQPIQTLGLSDGFRSVIALAGDLIWRLMQAFPDLDDPTQGPGVVLIDELDIHLHPLWQREIAGWLREVFPNIQFIVATHSPLVAIGAGSDALTLKLESTDSGITVEPSPDLSAYDVDRALRSPAFELESTHSPETQEKINRYYQLMQRRNILDETEKGELEALSIFMRENRPINPPPEPGSLDARIEAFLAERLP